jgi:hypothetical protein
LRNSGTTASRDTGYGKVINGQMFFDLEKFTLTLFKAD